MNYRSGQGLVSLASTPQNSGGSSSGHINNGLSDFVGAFSWLTPGFLQGRRMGIADNWQDKINYANVEQKQLNNLWDVATFPLDYSRSWDMTQLSNWSTDLAGQNYAINKLKFPLQVQQAMMQVMFGPYQEWLRNMALMRQGAQLAGGGMTKLPSVG